MDKEVILTQKGIDELEERLELLKTVKRHEISQQIKEARAFGDISENAEYDEAKLEQARIEGEIATIEKKLRMAKVIDEDSIDTGSVSLGVRVLVQNVQSKKEVEYTIVGTSEANPRERKISNEAPVGKALLGHREGNIVEVNVPSGVQQLKILKINK